ncbi:MAG: hypothetical protein ACXVP0_06500 [Bacteroidia bacterium]
MNWVDIGIFSNLFFNGYVFFKYPFELYLTYLPIIILLPAFFLKYKFPRELLYILLPLLITGMLNVVLDNNTFRNFFKIFANIAINIVFYRYVLEYYEYDVRGIFRMYMKCAFVVACLGLVQLFSSIIHFEPGFNWRMFLPLNKWGVNPGGLGVRINSTFSEPSGFGEAIAPAFFVCIYNFVSKKELYITRERAAVIVIAYLLSFSSVAYLGVFLSIILLAVNFGLVRYIFIAVPLSIFLFNIAYTNAKEFKVRIDGLNALFVKDILNKGVPKNETKSRKAIRIRAILLQIHGSSFVLYNNYYIAVENFKNNPLFGSGLGSHEFAFDKYNLNKIIGGIYEFNTSDANSMFLRTLSELGIMGLVFVFLFIQRYYISKNLLEEEEDDYWLISNALLVLLLTQLFRQGNYTFVGFFMYCWLYYYNSIHYQAYRSSGMYVSKRKKEII